MILLSTEKRCNKKNMKPSSSSTALLHKPRPPIRKFPKNKSRISSLNKNIDLAYSSQSRGKIESIMSAQTNTTTNDLIKNYMKRKPGVVMGEDKSKSNSGRRAASMLLVEKSLQQRLKTRRLSTAINELLKDHPSTFQTKTNQRPCHSAQKVASIHGYLFDKNIEELTKETQYHRRELLTLFNRFKALCSLAGTPDGIDKETFRKGVPLLSVEDDLFVNRVFACLDSDGSESIEWPEFLEAMNALEKGSREQKTRFLFKVYDVDGDGSISKEEMRRFFEHSLMARTDNTIRELSNFFISKIFAEMDTNDDGSMTLDEAENYINKHPEVQDIFGLFGRSMTSDRGHSGLYSLGSNGIKTEKSLYEIFEESKLSTTKNSKSNHT